MIFHIIINAISQGGEIALNALAPIIGGIIGSLLTILWQNKKLKEYIKENEKTRQHEKNENEKERQHQTVENEKNRKSDLVNAVVSNPNIPNFDFNTLTALNKFINATEEIHDKIFKNKINATPSEELNKIKQENDIKNKKDDSNNQDNNLVTSNIKKETPINKNDL